MTCRLARTGNDLPTGWRRARSGSVYRKRAGILAVVTVQLGAGRAPFELKLRHPAGEWETQGFANLDDAMATADERILPGGTAYLSDVGMTGPTDSVIGVRKEEAIARFLYQSPHKFSIPKGPVHLDAVVLDIDPSMGKANTIERIHIQS